MSSTPVAGPSESDASDAEQVYYDPLVFKGSNLAELTVNIALRARKPPRAHLKASHAQTWLGLMQACGAQLRCLSTLTTLTGAAYNAVLSSAPMSERNAACDSEHSAGEVRDSKGE